MEIIFFIIVLFIIFFSIQYLKEIGGRNRLGKLDLLIRLCVVVLLCIIYFENLKQTQIIKFVKESVDTQFNIVISIMRDDIIPLLEKGFNQLQQNQLDQSLAYQKHIEEILTSIQTTYKNFLIENREKYDSIERSIFSINQMLTNLNNLFINPMKVW